MEILMFEDKKNLLGKAKTPFEKYNDYLSIETTESSEKALELLEKENLDLIVLDYQKSKADIFEFFKLLKEDKQDDKTVIIVVNDGDDLLEKVPDSDTDSSFEKEKFKKSQKINSESFKTRETENSQTEKDKSPWKNLQNRLRKTAKRLERVREDARERSKRMKKLAEKTKKTRQRFKKTDSKPREEKTELTKVDDKNIKDLDPEVLPPRVLALKRFEEKSGEVIE